MVSIIETTTIASLPAITAAVEDTMVEESSAFTRKESTKSTRIAGVGSSTLIGKGGLVQAATATRELMPVLSKKGKVS